MKFVLKNRTSRIRDITIDAAQGTARGTSLVSGQAERRLQNITVANLRVKMLAENQPDKRATHALVFQGIDGLALCNVELEWDRETPERVARWCSATFPISCCGTSMAKPRDRIRHSRRL